MGGYVGRSYLDPTRGTELGPPPKDLDHSYTLLEDLFGHVGDGTCHSYRGLDRLTDVSELGTNVGDGTLFLGLSYLPEGLG